MEPRGRAGWLAFFIFVLIVSTLTVVSKSLTPIFEAESVGTVWPAGFKTVYLSSVLLPAGVLAFAAWMLITHNDWHAVKISIRCMWIGALGSVIAPTLVLNNYFPKINATAEALLPTFSSLIWLTIWTFYLLKSRRVKNTYTIGAPTLLESTISRESSLQPIFNSSSHAQEPSASAIKTSTAALESEVDSETEARSLRFTIFRADADGKWYWALQNLTSSSTIARSAGCITRSECLNNIKLVCATSSETPIWDKTSNEFVRLASDLSADPH